MLEFLKKKQIISLKNYEYMGIFKDCCKIETNLAYNRKLTLFQCLKCFRLFEKRCKTCHRYF